MRRKSQGLSETEKNGPGSPNIGEPVYLTIGRLGKPHGLEGAIIFYVITDFPERLKRGKKVFIGEEKLVAHIKIIKDHSRGLIIQFQEFSDISEIERFKSQYVYVSAKELPKLPDGEYYHHQLIGLKVFDPEGNEIGILQEILETGANDVYLIKDNQNKEILIPALLELIVNIDIKNQSMVVKPLDYYN